MNQDIIINPKSSGDPIIAFYASGFNNTPILLKTLSNYDTITGSGSALIFEGIQGQLFSITDNRSSGTLFNVTEKNGLSILSSNASGHIKIGEFSDYVSIGYGEPEYPFDVFNSGNFRDNVIFNSGVAVNTITSGLWRGYPVEVERGGTGRSLYSDGQILIGSGNTLISNTIQGSGDITVTNGPGSIIISSLGSSSSNNSNSLSSSSCGRLTLESYNPVSTGNITGSTIYFTPYLGNSISLIYNQQLQTYTFGEMSTTVAHSTPPSTNYLYDIFLTYDGTNLAFDKMLWQTHNLGSSTRSTPIVYYSGIPIASGYPEKRYLGTVRAFTNGSSVVTVDSLSRRLLFNANNQIFKILFAENIGEHTYSSSSIRNYNNSSTPGVSRVDFVNGLEYSILGLVCSSSFVTETSSSTVGISLNSPSSFNTKAFNKTSWSSGPALIMDNNAFDYIGSPLGWNYLQLCQAGASNSTFYSASLKAHILC